MIEKAGDRLGAREQYASTNGPSKEVGQVTRDIFWISGIYGSLAFIARLFKPFDGFFSR